MDKWNRTITHENWQEYMEWANTLPARLFIREQFSPIDFSDDYRKLWNRDKSVKDLLNLRDRALQREIIAMQTCFMAGL